MAKPKVKLVLSEENARHIEVLKEYSDLTGATVQELLDECLVDYIHAVICTGVEDIAKQETKA